MLVWALLFVVVAFFAELKAIETKATNPQYPFWSIGALVCFVVGVVLWLVQLLA